MALPANPKDIYFFQRDHRSSIRLNYQHWVTCHVCGYLVSPAIPTSPTIRIADIGTGTGIWPIEVASNLNSSTAQIDGFDISSDQFPPKDLMPENLHFYVHDVFESFPSEFHNAYDIVNIRFFAPVMNSSKVVPLLQNPLTITKSGGYIQWLEPDMVFTKAYTPSSSIPTVATEKLTAIMRKPTPENDFEYVASSNSGLQVIARNEHAVPDMYKVFNGQTQLMAFEDRLLKMEAASPSTQLEQAQQAKLLYKELLNEYQQGASVDWNFMCVVAKKDL